MKIIVFVKQVPDTDDVKLDPKTGNLCREGVKSMLNPLDANAVEAALRLREAHGGTVAAVTMGPPQAEEALKKALAMGLSALRPRLRRRGHAGHLVCPIEGRGEDRRF